MMKEVWIFVAAVAAVVVVVAVVAVLAVVVMGEVALLVVFWELIPVVIQVSQSHLQVLQNALVMLHQNLKVMVVQSLTTWMMSVGIY